MVEVVLLARPKSKHVFGIGDLIQVMGDDSSIIVHRHLKDVKSGAFDDDADELYNQVGLIVAICLVPSAEVDEHQSWAAFIIFSDAMGWCWLDSSISLIRSAT
jgi:hypothetical protein